MALIVEDGTNVPGAMSYIDAAFLREFAAQRGRTVPADDDEGTARIEQALVVAMDYLDTKSSQFKGQPSYDGQVHAWPRLYVNIGNLRVAFDMIPLGIKHAQAQLALAVLDGFDLMPTLDGAEVKREKVGPLETEYVTGTARGAGPVVAAAFALLQPFYAVVSLRTQRA